MHGAVQKAVPIVIRRRKSLEVLSFRHPFAGSQLVKGTIEVGEEPESAALRELAEESGIREATVERELGRMAFPEIGQDWHFYLCRVACSLAEEWTFFTQDDGGHLFQFFWHGLETAPDCSWHRDFQRALSFVRGRLEDVGALD